MPFPAKPKIYHIVHVDRLASILADGNLFSDTQMVQRNAGTMIGMGEIKQRRLVLPITCHSELTVGNCVPLYLCSRSYMLYVIYMANHPALTYRGGQQPIVHLEADLLATIQWAEENNRRWAFSLSNAGAYYTEFRNDVAQLGEINWAGVANTDFRSAEVKEAKQSEFLIEERFPWHLVERIGVYSQAQVELVSNAIPTGSHRPGIEIKRNWYY